MTPNPPSSTLAADRRMIQDGVSRSLPVEDVAQRRAALMDAALRIVQQAIRHAPALRDETPPDPA